MIQQVKLSERRITNQFLVLRLAGFAALFGLTVFSHAATIITDSGFESAGANTAYYTGSSIDGGAWSVTSGVVFIDSGDPYVYQGNNSLNLTGLNPDAVNSISQSLNTVAGQSYIVGFFANADSANIFSLFENGILVSGSPTSIANSGFQGTDNSGLFTAYAGSFLANSAVTTISFTDTSVPPIGSQFGSVVIDNVNVVATPEPSSILLVMTGLGGLGEAIRRKRAMALRSPR